GRPVRAGREGAGGGPGSVVGGGGAEGVRSGSWPAAAGDAGAPGGRGARAPVDHAPHRERRVVGGDPAEGARGAVRSVASRGAGASAGSVASVRGLCGVAASMAEGRG